MNEKKGQQNERRIDSMKSGQKENTNANKCFLLYNHFLFSFVCKANKKTKLREKGERKKKFRICDAKRLNVQQGCACNLQYSFFYIFFLVFIFLLRRLYSYSDDVFCFTILVLRFNFIFSFGFSFSVLCVILQLRILNYVR